MPWPMTLTPMNEAVRCENHVEKNLYKEKKITVTIREVMKDVSIALLSKKCEIFLRVGERLIELMVIRIYFA